MHGIFQRLSALAQRDFAARRRVFACAFLQRTRIENAGNAQSRCQLVGAGLRHDLANANRRCPVRAADRCQLWRELYVTTGAGRVVLARDARRRDAETSWSGSNRMEKNFELTASDRGAPQSANVERYVVAATSDSHFAWIRTRLAADSTLMGWIRLATTLIGFGFTIVQFFDRFGKMESVKAAMAPNLPRYMGLALLSSGIVGLLIAIWQYVRLVDYLHSAAFERIAFQSHLPGPRAALAVAALCRHRNRSFSVAAVQAVVIALHSRFGEMNASPIFNRRRDVVLGLRAHSAGVRGGFCASDDVAGASRLASFQPQIHSMQIGGTILRRVRYMRGACRLLLWKLSDLLLNGQRCALHQAPVPIPQVLAAYCVCASSSCRREDRKGGRGRGARSSG